MELDNWFEWDIEKFPLFTFGISHSVIDNKNRKWELMFYEIDDKDYQSKLSTILPYFNDCILLKTSKGYHFVGFSIMNQSTKKCAKKLSKELNQDYYQKDYQELSLRIFPKYDTRTDKKTFIPKFIKVLKYPSLNSIISLEHLKIYTRLSKIPKKVLREYKSRCKFIKAKYKIKLYTCRR